MNQPKKSNIALINDNIVMLSNVDRADMNTILQDMGMIPLSKEEREYLQDIHDNLNYTTGILSEAISIMKKNNEDISLIEDADNIIRENMELLEVTIDEVGHGFDFSLEEEYEKER